MDAVFLGFADVFLLWERAYARDPPVQNLVWTVSLAQAEKFATEAAKHHGKCSEMLVFLRKKGMKTVQIVKHYGSSKNTTASSAVVFLLRKGLWVV